MAILFESPKDPYGLQQGISTLGNALQQAIMRKQEHQSQLDQEQRYNQAKLADEQRKQEEIKRISSSLGKNVEQFQPKEDSKESWDSPRIAKFMAKSLEDGIPVPDVFKAVHMLQTSSDFHKEIKLKSNREKRLNIQNQAKDVSSMYQLALKSLKEETGNAPREQRGQLEQKRKALHKEFGQNLARVRRGQKPVFVHLDVGEEEEGQEMSVQGASAPQQNQGMAQPQQQAQGAGQKVRWDPKNPQHQEVALKALQQASGDRAKANELLSEAFER